MVRQIYSADAIAGDILRRRHHCRLHAPGKILLFHTLATEFELYFFSLLGMGSNARTSNVFINPRDPYQLERLAEELANRETNLRNNTPPSDLDVGYTDLPDYGPLSHHNSLLTGSVFNVEEFLLSRARATLPELRTELRDYLSTLKEELVQLINNDYEAFISLSTDLRSEGSRLRKMRGPLVDLQDRIMVRLISKYMLCD